MSLVRKLQADALDDKVLVSSLLRTAKVAATKLDLADALVWINRELDGYIGLKAEDLPPYRRLSGTPRGWNPYHGWQPIHFENADVARRFSKAPIGQAIAGLEANIKDKTEGSLQFPYPPEMKAILNKSMEFPTETTIFLSYSQVWDILNAVRNLVLNWTLDLEKAGVLGDDMHFTTNEVKQARPASQQFVIQNVGVLGDVSGQATVSNTQTVELKLDPRKVVDFVAAARPAVNLLPSPSDSRIAGLLTELDEAAKAPKPKTYKLHSLLESTRNVCEGITGNVAAEGIIQLISRLLG